MARINLLQHRISLYAWAKVEELCPRAEISLPSMDPHTLLVSRSGVSKSEMGQHHLFVTYKKSSPFSAVSTGPRDPVRKQLRANLGILYGILSNLA